MTSDNTRPASWSDAGYAPFFSTGAYHALHEKGFDPYCLTCLDSVSPNTARRMHGLPEMACAADEPSCCDLACYEDEGCRCDGCRRDGCRPAEEDRQSGAWLGCVLVLLALAAGICIGLLAGGVPMTDLRSAAQAVVDSRDFYVSGALPKRLTEEIDALRAALGEPQPEMWLNRDGKAVSVTIAAPPAGLREAVEQERDHWRSAYLLADKHRTELMLAAPSCGHPIDAERLAEAIWTAEERDFLEYADPVEARKFAKRIAAAYAGEGE